MDQERAVHLQLWVQRAKAQASLQQLLSTPEGRAKIAASMVSPMRCGGCNYDEQGRRVYMYGGVRMLEDSEQHQALRKKHGYD